jgi:AmiR/NasT family two-component response regulator
VLLLSSQTDLAAEAKKLGAAGYLPKPLRMAELLSTMQHPWRSLK